MNKIGTNENEGDGQGFTPEGDIDRFFLKRKQKSHQYWELREYNNFGTRTIDEKSKGRIITGVINSYKKKKKLKDKLENINRKSIPFPVQNGSSSVQNGNSSVQNGNSLVQNGKIIMSINIKNIL